MSEQLTNYKGIDPDNALTWPEDSPAVSMNTKLSKYGKRMDFDMAEFHRLMDQEKIDQDLRDNLTINYTDVIRLNGKKQPGIAGVYQDDKNELQVSIRPGSKSEFNDGTTIHELEHFIQDLKHEYNMGNRKEWLRERARRWKVIRFATPIGVMATNIALDRSGISPGWAKEVEGIFTTWSTVNLVRAFMGRGGFLTTWIEYYTRPEERKARRFARKNNDKYDIFTSEDSTKGLTAQEAA